MGPGERCELPLWVIATLLPQKKAIRAPNLFYFIYLVAVVAALPIGALSASSPPIGEFGRYFYFNLTIGTATVVMSPRSTLAPTVSHDDCRTE